MSVQVAGRVVRVGDTLYHARFQAWGKVEQIEGTSASLRIGGQTVRFTNEGMNAGSRQVFWHEPLFLDMPQRDISKYQRVLDKLIEEGL